MTNYKILHSIKFFFKDFSKPFKKLFSSLKEKWVRSGKVANLQSSLITDLNKVKDSLINDGNIVQNDEERDRTTKNNSAILLHSVGKKTLKELKIVEFFKKLEKVKKNDKYEDTINSMFLNYYSKLGKRVDKLVTKLETKSFIDKVEYDEESSISKSDYKKQKIELQIELVKLQEWAIANGKKIAIAFEGRDAAGKGSSIKRFIEYLNPKNFRVVALGIPTKEESTNWFPRYEKHLPKDGEIVFFDRSWYNRGVIEPTMDYCTDEQYEDFMNNVNQWEKDLIDNDIILFKFWFSVDKEKQLERFELRKESPLKHWKYSPNDEKTLDKWNVMTKYKNQMFERTSTPNSPWVIVNSNDKRVSRLNSIRYILSNVDYTGKDEDKNLSPSSDVVKVFK